MRKYRYYETHSGCFFLFYFLIYLEIVQRAASCPPLNNFCKVDSCLLSILTQPIILLLCAQFILLILDYEKVGGGDAFAPHWVDRVLKWKIKKQSIAKNALYTFVSWVFVPQHEVEFKSINSRVLTFCNLFVLYSCCDVMAKIIFVTWEQICFFKKENISISKAWEGRNDLFLFFFSILDFVTEILSVYFTCSICPLTNEKAVFQPSAGAALGCFNT